MLDTRARGSYDSSVPMWRCPHCGAPQPESSRCWVCHRSSTSCLTCRHFRSAVVAKVGYCALDRTRSPLTGDEIRPCWEASQAPGATVPVVAWMPEARRVDPVPDGQSAAGVPLWLDET
jgi:hypothetical protein